MKRVQRLVATDSQVSVAEDGEMNMFVVSADTDGITMTAFNADNAMVGILSMSYAEWFTFAQTHGPVS